MERRNARFWTWHRDGWVKLTLRPQQTLAVVSGGPTSEGWHWHATTWTHDGDGVLREHTDEGCDCDGRYSAYQDCYCPLDQLAAMDLTDQPDGQRVPDWQVGRTSQRDYTAEAAGY